MSRRTVFALSFAAAVAVASTLAYRFYRTTPSKSRPLYYKDMLLSGEPTGPFRESMEDLLRNQSLKEEAKMKAARRVK